MGTKPVAAQNDSSFTEAELHRALSWGMPDSEACRLAKYICDDPAVIATIPELRDLGPSTTMYSEGFLLILSLVSEDTNRKVERELLENRLGKGLTAEERANWEKRRGELKSELIKAGKISD